MLGSWPLCALLRSAKTTHLCRPAQVGPADVDPKQHWCILQSAAKSFMSKAYHIARSCAHSTCMYKCGSAGCAPENASHASITEPKMALLVAKSISADQSCIWSMYQGCLPAVAHKMGSEAACSNTKDPCRVSENLRQCAIYERLPTPSFDCIQDALLAIGLL